MIQVPAISICKQHNIQHQNSYKYVNIKYANANIKLLVTFW